jgi:hypothetical protein
VRPPLHVRLVNNSLYFASRALLWAFRGSWVLAGLAVLAFGFFNVLCFLEVTGITAAVLFEFQMVRERRMMKTAILQYFGVPDERRVLE